MRFAEIVMSPDAVLVVTVTEYNPDTGLGRLTIEELQRKHARYYVTIFYGIEGSTRIDYKTYDLKKASEFSFAANRGDEITGITVTPVVPD